MVQRSMSTNPRCSQLTASRHLSDMCQVSEMPTRLSPDLSGSACPFPARGMRLPLLSLRARRGNATSVRWLCWCGLVTLLCCWFPSEACHAQRASSSPSPAAAEPLPLGGSVSQLTTDAAGSVDSYAVIEQAIYRAQYLDGDLVNGTLDWQVLQRGSGTALIDLSEVNFALKDLTSPSGPVISGTTNQLQRVLLVNEGFTGVQGAWSLRGETLPGATLFDCHFAPALHTRLELSLPASYQLRSSVGQVSEGITPTASSAGATNSSTEVVWTVELGRHRTTTLSVIRRRRVEELVFPKYEIETVHLPRQDGVFVQSDFSLEGLIAPLHSELEFRVPATFVVHAITASGVPLHFERDVREPRSVTVALPENYPRGRLNLRMQGFQPVRWIRPQPLPLLSLTSAVEARRVASFRVEMPLELQHLEVNGFFQTGLAREPRGEVWRFEAFRENPSIVVDVGQTSHDLQAEIHTLHDLDTPLPQAISQIRVNARSGRTFDMSLSIPPHWTIVSINPLDPQSEISTWTVTGDQVLVQFKSAISTETKKSLEIRARTNIPTMDLDQKLPTPVVLHASSSSIQSDWLLPEATGIELSSGGVWGQLTAPIDLSRFANLVPRPQASHRSRQRSFLNSNVNVAALPTFRFINVRDLRATQLDGEAAHLIAPTIETPTVSERGEVTAALTILTQADALVSGSESKLVHHVTLEFFGSVDPQDFRLSLPQSCRLSALAVDGQALTVFRAGEEIQFPEDLKGFSEITLIYVTTTRQNWFRQRSEIPLPDCSVPITGLDWVLEFPNERTLSRIDLPSGSATSQNFRTLFGPMSLSVESSLTDVASAEIDSASTTINAERVSAARGITTYHFRQLEGGQEVSFESWDRSRARNVSWVAMIACMLVGVGGRSFGIRHILKMGPYWVSILILFQFLATDEWSLINGGMLAGSLISILFPAEILKLSEGRQFAVSRPKLATASLLLLLSAGYANFVRAQTPVASTVAASPSLRAIGELNFLLSAVDYELVETNPAWKYRAVLRVLTHQRRAETLVELPYTGVIFPAGAECLVDGTPQSLIPMIDGRGVIVRVPRLEDKGLNLQADETSEAISPLQATPVNELKYPAANGWEEHEIRFEFLVRSEEGGVHEAPKIPPLLDSELTFPNELDPHQLRRRGQILGEANNQLQIALGPVQRLGMLPQAADNTDQQLNLHALLNVSSSRILGQVSVEQTVDQPAGKRYWKLPAAALITNVSGAHVQQWFVSIDESGKRYLVIDQKESTAGNTTLINFSHPATMNTNGEVIIPRMDWLERESPQMIGLRSPAAVTLSVPTGQVGVEQLAVEDWPTNDPFGRSRPAFVLRTNSQNEMRVALHRNLPASRHSLTESLVIDRSVLSWTAEIDFDIQQLPIFVHELEVSNGLRINSVRLAETGEERSLRFHQDQGRVTIFVPGGQLGNRRLQLVGELIGTSDARRPVPEVRCLASDLTDHTLMLFDKTNWDVEVIAAPPANPLLFSSEGERFQTIRTLAKFSPVAGERPVAIRLQPPPSAVRVDSAIQLRVDEGQPWNMVQLLRYTSEELPLTSVQLLVPPNLENVRIGPRFFRQERTETADGTRFTVFVPERFTAGVTIQVFARIDESHLAQQTATTPESRVYVLPEAVPIAARSVSRHLILNENKSVALQPGSGVSLKSNRFPEWLPLQWREGTSSGRLNAYQLLESKTILTPAQLPDPELQTVIDFAESMIWIDRESPKKVRVSAKAESRSSAQIASADSNRPHPQIRGLTQLWLRTGYSRQFEIPFRNEVVVEHVYLPGRESAAIQIVDGQQRISLSTSEPVLPVTILWSEPSDNHDEIHSPFHADANRSFPHLLGVPTFAGEQVLATNLKPLRRSELLLMRWDTLLGVLESLRRPLQVESPLHQELRELSAEVQQGSVRQAYPAEQLEDLKQLTIRQHAAFEGLMLSTSATPASPASTVRPPGVPLQVQGPFQSISWFFIPASESTEVTPTAIAGHLRLKSPRHWQAWFFYGFGLTLLGVLFFMGRQHLVQAIAALQENPILSLCVLGTCWLFFFKPTFLGLVILFTAFGLHWLKWTEAVATGQR